MGSIPITRSRSKKRPFMGRFSDVVCGSTHWFDNAMSGNIVLDANRLKVIGGPSEQLNVAPKDGRIAEAMRDGHIPITRSRSNKPR